jgi:hypothetical protein
MQLFCATYSTSDGKGQGYLDGVTSGPGAVSTPTTLLAVNSSWDVNDLPTGLNPVIGQMGGAFAIPTRLSSARIAAIARAVLADQLDSDQGLGSSFSRASARFCDNGQGGGSDLPNNRVCVTRGGISKYSDATPGLLIRVDEFNNAAWNNVGSPTMLTDVYTHPNGTLTADSIQDTGIGEFQGRSQTVASTSATKHTFSVWIRGAVGGESASLTITGTGNAAGNTTCNFTNLTTTFDRKVCTSPVAFGGGLTAVTGAVRYGTAITDIGTIGVARAELVAQGRPGPAPYAAGIAVTTARDNWTLNGSRLSTSTGCFSADFVPEYWGSTTTRPAFNFLGFDSNGTIYSGDPTSWYTYDGVSSLLVNPVPPLLAATPTRFRTTYSGSSMSVYAGSATSTGSFDGTYGANPSLVQAPFFVGGEMDGVIRNIQADPRIGKCQ